MTRKLTLTQLRVKSFPTSDRGGLNAIAQQYDTVHSGVCTCLMPCGSDPRLNCTDVCPDDIEPVELTGRC